MPKAKQDKYDLLASVIDAIYDMNKNVIIETLHEGSAYDGKLEVPGPTWKRWATHSDNWARAQSIKIGDIYMRRIPLEPSKSKDGLFEIDNGVKYIVRTPDQEVEFSQNDDDFIQVWYGALMRYDIDHGVGKWEILDVMEELYGYLRNPKLREAAGKGIKQKDTKSKYDAAIEKLKEMGVQPKRLATYIQQQKKQND